MTRKILAVLLALALVFSLALTACGDNGKDDAEDTKKADDTKKEDKKDDAKDTAGSDEKEETVAIDWYVRQDMTNLPDFEEYVWPEMHQYFLDNANVDVTYHGFGSADYGTKFAAAITSGSNIDLMFVAVGTTGFYEWYERNALEPLDDLLNEYAPELVKAMPDYAFASTTIDGKIYAMPTIKDLCVDIGFFFNETMIDDCGARDAWNAIDFESAKDFDTFFHDMLGKRNELHPDQAEIPLVNHYTTQWAYWKGDEITPGVLAKIDGLRSFDEQEEGEIFNLYATEEYKRGLNLIKNWVDDGINAYDAGNVSGDDNKTWRQQGAVLGYWTWGNICANPDEYAEYGWTLGLRHPNNAFTYTVYPLYCAHAISALTTEEKKVGAMKLYNLLAEDPYVGTTMRFGKEGVHWEEVEKDGVKRANFDFEGGLNADPANKSYYLWYFAEFGNITTTYLPMTEADDFFKVMEETNNGAIASPYMGWLLVTTNVTNEIAAMATVIDEFNKDLMYGMIDDIDGRVDAFNAAAEANGIQAIVDECVAQTTEWLG